MLQTLFENVTDAVLVVDDDGRCVDANSAACRLFGVPYAELLRREVTAFIAAPWAKLVATGRERGTVVVRSRDGAAVEAAYRAHANFAPGRHLAVLSEVGQGQRPRPASDAFLERVIASSHDCIKVLDLEGRLISMSPGGRRLLEIEDLTPFIGRPWLDLWTGGDYRRAADAIERARRGEAVRFEGFGVTPAGTPRWWETSLAPINGPDGRPERLLAVSRDVSDRVRAEQERMFLHRSTEYLASSLDFDSTVHMIARVAVPFLADFCFLDLVEDGVVRRVAWFHGDPASRAGFDEVVRYVPPASALAHPVAGTLAESKARLVSDVTDDWVDAVATSADHARFMRSLGMRSVMTVPLTDARNLTSGVLTLGTAQSGRRYEAHHLALAEQLALRAELAIQNSRLFEASRRAQELAEQASRSKDEFLAMLAHELRNPLAAIVNGVAMLDRLGSVIAEARQACGIIRRQSEHLAGLIDDLLDVARIGQGKLELHLAPVDLRVVVEGALEAERHRLDARHQHIDVALPAEPLLVRGDAVRLRQIAANLLSNASKYTPTGGLVTVTLGREGGAASLSVRDNGIGIPTEKLGAIFDLFTQLGAPPGRREGGLGIGLTLVKRLTDVHGGTVVALSAGSGKGSEFVVRMPLLEGAPAAPPTPAPAPAPDAYGCRVLVIEDNPDARDMLAMTLRLAGHEVSVAGSAQEGLARAMAERPRAVIVDIGLPDASGYELAPSLREALGDGALLVAFSGYGQPDDRRRSMAAGFDAHIVKPAAPEELLSVLAAHTRGRPA
ncbi:MAG TPA: PAS domain-containing protein [Methylomirabilota bacterium]|jgi:PAS domain S-box-containing protein